MQLELCLLSMQQKLNIVLPAGRLLAGVICNSGCSMQDNMDAKAAPLPLSEQASKQENE